MTELTAVRPLRQRMIEAMTIRRFGEHTQRDYVRRVREFTAFLGLSPERAEPEDLPRYQLDLASLGATLRLPRHDDRMARIPSPQRLPSVLSTEEVLLLLAHARSLKDRAALSIAYGCGLRVSEIAILNPKPFTRGEVACPPLSRIEACQAGSKLTAKS